MRYRALGLRGALKASALSAGIIAALSLGTVGSARATTIYLDLGDSPHITSKVTNSFAALDGIALQGQTLSLDFRFSKGEFVRLFTITSDPFVALVRLQTNSPGMLDFLNGTGFLVDKHGHPFEQPQQLGSASGDDGSLAAGLFPLLPGDLQRPLDFFGIHFDLTLPMSHSISITGEEFVFSSDSGHPFGVGPGVPRDIIPDQGSTLPLLSLASLTLILAQLRLTRVGGTPTLYSGTEFGAGSAQE
jgi:hypothetical protein